LKTAVLSDVSGITGKLKVHFGQAAPEPSVRTAVVRLILNMRTAGAHADEARVLELEVRDDVLHDGPASDGPFLGVLVISVHVPVLERLEDHRAKRVVDLTVQRLFTFAVHGDHGHRSAVRLLSSHRGSRGVPVNREVMTCE